MEVLTTADYHFDDGISQNKNVNGGQDVLEDVAVLLDVSIAAALTT